ncbi:beta strand repeat-containing protein [Flaviaesturariibacter amylovorans]|uniref:Ig-like domain-containing protein n=1 Tax=Flaviaesturariibacter amylovorans TaxID=1084520 RepID=A0ABP8HM84_9BACT
MVQFYKRLTLAVSLLGCSLFGQAQVSVTASAGTAGPTTYTTLKGAFDAINAGTHGGLVTVSITANTTETATATLNAPGGAQPYSTINIQPSATVTVSGNIAGALINLNGATGVNILGNNQLTLQNTNTAGYVVRFVNDAISNSVKQTKLRGNYNGLDASNAINGGIVFFDLGAANGEGNSGNLIENCDIDGGNTAICGIYSKGLSTTAAVENFDNTVRGCTIHDVMNPAVAATTAILLNGGNDGWTIENNSIYNSAFSTTLQFVIRSILIIPSFTSDSHEVKGNMIGGNAANATGTLTITGSGTGAAANAVGYIGLDIETGGPGNLVQNNTVKNITLTYGFSGGSFANSAIFGFIGGYSGTTTFTGNTVSNLSFTNSAGFMNFQAMHFNARVTTATTITPTFTISNNTITALTVNSGGAAGDVNMHGIRLETSSAASLGATATSRPAYNVTGNNINNLTVPFTGVASSFIRCIGTVATQGGTGATASTANLHPNVDITNNSIHTNSCAAFTGATAAGQQFTSGVVTGIHFGGSSNATNASIARIRQNTIYNLSATNTGDVNSVVIGILASTGIHDISRNRIYDLRNASTGATAANLPGIVGMTVRSITGTSNVTNNFISIGTGQAGNIALYGILQNFNSTGTGIGVNVYHNTVVVTGAGGAGNTRATAAYLRGTETLGNTITTTTTLRNNIFYNTRSGGGNHYAIANTYTTAPTGWTSDSNNLYATTAANIALWGTTPSTLAAYQTSSGGDANSKSVTVSFTDVATADLHLSGASANDANLNGTPIASVTTDYDGDTRSTTTPKMGADEPPVTCTAPAITTQPTAQTVCAGQNFTFTVVASGTTPTYQWLFNGNPINGATGATYTSNGSTAASAGNYSVQVSNGCGNVTSNAVALTVNAGVAITTQPTSNTVCTGESATFTVGATGANLTYQWLLGGNQITGANSASYTVTNATTGGTYSVQVMSSCGNVTSNAVTLTVNAATAITTQPVATTVCAGVDTAFNVSATGANLTYQWRLNGNPIAGATSSRYALPAVTTAQAGNYSVQVGGSCGAPVTSNVVALVVNTGGSCTTAVPNISEDVTSSVLMPNVVRNGATLRLNARRAMNMTWVVTDGNGKVVLRTSQAVTAGQNDLRLPLQGLAPGSYQITGYPTKGNSVLLRFVKL